MKHNLLVVLLFSGLAVGQGVVNGARDVPVPNDGSTGTTLDGTAVEDSIGQAISATTAQASVQRFIVIGGAGTSGYATLGQSGIAPCLMDSTVESSAGPVTIRESF